jgi:adenylate cyclase class 2
MRGQLEVEQKFSAADPARVERLIADRGATFAPPLAQVDRYYAHPARDFARTDEALRIRRVGQCNYVTYKGPKLDPLTKTRREIELPLPAGEEGFAQFADLLEALGFRAVAEVRKQRRITHLDWQSFPVEVALDDVEGVGRFIELEVAAEPAAADAARAALASLAEHLGLHANERRSYLELLLLSRSATCQRADECRSPR